MSTVIAVLSVCCAYSYSGPTFATTDLDGTLSESQYSRLAGSVTFADGS